MSNFYDPISELPLIKVLWRPKGLTPIILVRQSFMTFITVLMDHGWTSHCTNPTDDSIKITKVEGNQKTPGK